MNSRKTLFLAVLTVIAAGLVIWDHFQGVPTSERDAKSKRILNFDAQQVTRIELTRSNQTVVLAKTGDRWDLQQPLAVRAEVSTIRAALSELEFAERTRTLTEKDLQVTSLAGFGLEPPRASIQLTLKSGPVTLLIGSETPTKNALYVQVAGHRQVGVGPLSLYDQAALSLDRLRSHAAIEFTPANVTRLEIKTGTRFIELTKSAATTNTETRWTITQPLPARADEGKISELLRELSGLRVADFVSDDSKDLHTYRLDEPERTVTVYSGEIGQTLLFGNAPTNDASKVYATLKGANAIFTLAGSEAKKFALQINDLRDPRVLVFEPAAVTTVDIVRGADKLSLRHSTNGWQLAGATNSPAADVAVAQWLEDLAALRAKRFVADVTTDPQQFGLAAPVTAVTLTGSGTNILAQLAAGTVDVSNAVRFVKRADEPFIYGIETNAGADWLVEPLSALAIKLLPAPVSTNAPPAGKP